MGRMEGRKGWQKGLTCMEQPRVLEADSRCWRMQRKLPRKTRLRGSRRFTHRNGGIKSGGQVLGWCSSYSSHSEAITWRVRRMKR